MVQKEGKKISQFISQEICERNSKSDLEGLIFTYVWAFDMQEDWDYIDKVCNIF